MCIPISLSFKTLFFNTLKAHAYSRITQLYMLVDKTIDSSMRDSGFVVECVLSRSCTN